MWGTVPMAAESVPRIPVVTDYLSKSNVEGEFPSCRVQCNVYIVRYQW